MKKEKRDRIDLSILMAITGCEDPGSLGIQVEENYLIREAMENRREQGLRVPERWIPLDRSQDEKDTWKRIKWLEELEQARTNRPNIEYAGADEEEDMVRTNKPIDFVDSKVLGVVYETKICIKQIKSNASGKWLTILTIGENQDINFVITARNDGGGTCLSTDHEPFKQKKSTIEIVKI